MAALHLAGGGLIAFLGSLGFGAFAAALAPTLLPGLAWERVTARAAAASMATGLATFLALEVLAPDLAVPAAALTMAAAFTVLAAGSLLSPTPPLSARTPLALTLRPGAAGSAAEGTCTLLLSPALEHRKPSN